MTNSDAIHPDVTDETLAQRASRLVDVIRDYKSVAVAFSGGVDSALVAKAAAIALGENAVAVTAVSASLAQGELAQAKSVARQIGIRHQTISTTEFENEDYLANPSNRCFFCKTELYTQLASRLKEFGVSIVANGANLDDAGDHRPGLHAARDHAVRSPLIEAGLDKADVRELARHWNLTVWNKPAMPCLSSRIAYGVEVTPERVRRIDSAERFLKSTFNLNQLRVRLEANELARIEVAESEIPKLFDAEHRRLVTTKLRELGFRYVTIDLEGFRSGSMNEVLPLESLTIFNGMTE